MTFKHQNKFASKLSPEKVFTIRQRLATGEETQVALAQEYRVSIGTIRNIYKGITWQDMPMVESEADKQAGAIKSQQLFEALMQQQAEADAAMPPTPKEIPPWDKIPQGNATSLVEQLRQRKAQLEADQPTEEIRNDGTAESTDDPAGNTGEG